MITTIKVNNTRHPGIPFREHDLAHKYLDKYYEGIEIGAAAHNPFGLENCNNVGLDETLDKDDFEFFKQAQVDMCGEYANIDVAGEADKLPFENCNKDYVLTSHVIEHLPNPIKAFKEWDRVLRNSGIIFSIIPLRNALSADIMRKVTPVNVIVNAYLEDWTVDTVPFIYEATVPGGRRGHYFVYTPESFTELLKYCKENFNLNWEIIEIEQIDTKVGNGFTIVARKNEKSESINPENS